MPRIYYIPTLEAKNSAGDLLLLNAQQTHYVSNVMRLLVNDKITIFNEQMGEWQGSIIKIQKKQCCVILEHCLRLFKPAQLKLGLAFSPVKIHSPSFIVQKAVELGVEEISPILMERTIVRSVNQEKLHLCAIEAIEQCGRLSPPTVLPIKTLLSFLESRTEDDLLFWGSLEASRHLLDAIQERYEPFKTVWLLIGPEGGLSDSEMLLLRKQINAVEVHMGQLILRAETAAIAGLAILQTLLQTG